MQTIRRLFLLASLALPLPSAVVAAAAVAPPISLLKGARVMRIVDGDTYEVLTGGVRVRLRVRNVDAPELTQPFGQMVADSVNLLLRGRLVYLLPTMARDLYGRSLSPVWLYRPGLAPLSVDSLLVAKGWAWPVNNSGVLNAGAFAAQGAAALAARRGLWHCYDTQPPVPPKVWRGLNSTNKRRYRGVCTW